MEIMKLIENTRIKKSIKNKLKSNKENQTFSGTKNLQHFIEIIANKKEQ